MVKPKSSNQSVPNATRKPTPMKPIPFCDGTSFISQINTNNTSVGSSSNNRFMLPLVSSGLYNFIIDWALVLIRI